MSPHTSFPTITAEGLALYIHWPWCKKKCPYCDFNSHVATDAPVEAYVKSLKKQMNDFHQASTSKHSLTSVFFGGGTPSLMPPTVVQDLLEHAQKLWGFNPHIEVTLEANPTSSEAQKFKDFVSAGVNRFSVGMQSLTQEELSFLGREHNVSEALGAIEAAQEACGNVNLDLIYGLPNQDLNQWLKHLDQVFALGTQHISCYQLTIEKNTGFYSDWRKGRLKPASEDVQADFYEQTTQKLVSQGYEHYEISNYAKPGKACRHNTHIWKYGTYLGVGAGAHGRMMTNDGLFATRNYKMPETFIEKLQNSDGIFERELLTREVQSFEATLLGLRLKEGLPLDRLEQITEASWKDTIDENSLGVLVENGLLKIVHSEGQNGTHFSSPILQVTEPGFLILDSVIEHLIKA